MYEDIYFNEAKQFHKGDTVRKGAESRGKLGFLNSHAPKWKDKVTRGQGLMMSLMAENTAKCCKGPTSLLSNVRSNSPEDYTVLAKSKVPAQDNPVLGPLGRSERA